MQAIPIESLTVLVRGILVGLILAIPVGPTAILCMRRTLERGPVFGFATGLGASLADAFYGAAVAFGVAAISGFVKDHFFAVRVVGGLFMLVLAARLIRAQGMPKTKPETPTTGHALGALASGFLLTVTNPMTMGGFAAVFTIFHFHEVLQNADLATILVLGVALGSALWWMVLTLGVFRLRHLLSERAMHRINVGAGATLALFGAYALVSVLMKIAQ